MSGIDLVFVMFDVMLFFNAFIKNLMDSIFLLEMFFPMFESLLVYVIFWHEYAGEWVLFFELFFEGLPFIQLIR